jgi:hypothetical protein
MRGARRFSVRYATRRHFKQCCISRDCCTPAPFLFAYTRTLECTALAGLLNAHFGFLSHGFDADGAGWPPWDPRDAIFLGIHHFTARPSSHSGNAAAALGRSVGGRSSRKIQRVDAEPIAQTLPPLITRRRPFSISHDLSWFFQRLYIRL